MKRRKGWEEREGGKEGQRVNSTSIFGADRGLRLKLERVRTASTVLLQVTSSRSALSSFLILHKEQRGRGIKRAKKREEGDEEEGGEREELECGTKKVSLQIKGMNEKVYRRKKRKAA